MSTMPEVRFFQDILGNKIAYAEHGEGPLVVCPAWWISHVEKDWANEPFRQFFKRLGEGLRIVRYDRPGVGLSDRNSGERILDDETALLSALVDELGENELSFFAVSCGGPPALAFAAGNRKRVNKICFYGSYGCGAELGPPDVRQAVLSTVRAHWGLGSRALADMFVPGEPRDALDMIASQQREATDADTAARLLQLTYDMDATPFLGDVTSECLIVHRRGDRAVPHEAGRKLAAGLGNARLVSLDGRAHPPWVAGDEIAVIANSFFRSHPLDQSPDSKIAPGHGRGCNFDEPNRRLIIDQDAIALTPLEFGVLRALTHSTDTVVTRDDLLLAVWNQEFEGSNKIDAVVRNLRKKLGRFAASIETVIGHGYRFIGWTTGE